jgi:hypothetical protein
VVGANKRTVDTAQGDSELTSGQEPASAMSLSRPDTTHVPKAACGERLGAETLGGRQTVGLRW